MKLFLFLLLLPYGAMATDLYQIHPMSEQEVQHTYLQILRETCHHADSEWKRSSFDPKAGYWGDGVSSGNGGIRTAAGLVLACGTLLKYDDGLSEADRHNLLAKASAALRFVTATHVTGTQKCTDGKSWGATPKFGPESWQSGLWTGTLLFGAWLIWDQLDPALQQEIQQMTGSEDDILAARKPPNGLWLDTKAEENGWEVPPLVLGELMFPTNSHNASWREGARRYMMNTLCTAADLNDTNVVDGRPVNQWVGGANLQPDFTLENHNIFHPSYVACSSYFLTQAAMAYTFAGQPIPQSAGHHLLDTWKMFQTLMLPWGESAFPQGMDWELHGLSCMNLFASLATHWQDPFAARMEQQHLQYVRAWQVMCHGDLTLPGSHFGIIRHSIGAEQAAYAFLAHKIFGPAATELTADATVAQVTGVREHPYIDFITHRTGQKFVSFSWKNRIMGQLIPVGPGHEGNPEFTAPIVNGLVGSFDLAPRGNAKVSVLEHSWKETPAGFETTGALLINGGKLKQTLTVNSIGEQTVVYQDRVTAVTNVTVQRELGLPLGVENDSLSGGTRTVFTQTGQTIFDCQKHQPMIGLAGTWANVDNRLGLVMLAGANLTYAQATNYTPGIAVREDILYGANSEQTRKFKTGELVARRVGILFAEVSAEETAALAQSCQITGQPGAQVLRFKQPDGKIAEVPLP